jgi:23S rRNA (adenine1618-N6)-methyltransferase
MPIIKLLSDLTSPSGVGASCIYALLGTVTRPNWRFFGTDIDDKSFAFAQRNVASNDLDSRIRLHKAAPQDPLLPLDALGARHLDFAMCNPPFYQSRGAMLMATAAKGAPPPAVCTGATVEMITEGGDAGFAARIVKESAALKERVRWCTCLLGRLPSVGVVVAALRKEGCRNWAVGTLAEGGRTRRWVVAWSWADYRPCNVSDPPLPPAGVLAHRDLRAGGRLWGRLFLGPAIWRLKLFIRFQPDERW